MATMNEHFVEESMRLSSYRGTPEDNGAAEPQYPPTSETAALFA